MAETTNRAQERRMHKSPALLQFFLSFFGRLTAEFVSKIVTNNMKVLLHLMNHCSELWKSFCTNSKQNVYMEHYFQDVPA